MGNPFLFADRFSGAVVHLTTDYIEQAAGSKPRPWCNNFKQQKQKMPATV
jgi:hypothetical protein